MNPRFRFESLHSAVFSVQFEIFISMQWSASLGISLAIIYDDWYHWNFILAWVEPYERAHSLQPALTYGFRETLPSPSYPVQAFCSSLKFSLSKTLSWLLFWLTLFAVGFLLTWSVDFAWFQIDSHSSLLDLFIIFLIPLLSAFLLVHLSLSSIPGSWLKQRFTCFVSFG